MSRKLLRGNNSVGRADVGPLGSGAPLDRADNPLAYDLITMLCCVLDVTGPVEFTGMEVVTAEHSRLKIEQGVNADTYLLSYGERNVEPN